MSFATKLSAIDPQSVYGVRVLMGKTTYYYVLAVDRNKARVFRKLLTRPLQNVNFADFGTILLSGKGREPDERVVQMFRKKYAVDLTFA